MPRPAPRFALTLVLLPALWLSGCGDGPRRPQGADATGAGSAMEFRGERPCVDCLSIESWLRLEQQGEVRRYRLVELYRGRDRQRRFEDAGEWVAEGELLRLRSPAGGERAYAQLPDGSLQARDSHGRPLPAASDDVMLPVTFDRRQ